MGAHLSFTRALLVLPLCGCHPLQRATHLPQSTWLRPWLGFQYLPRENFFCVKRQREVLQRLTPFPRLDYKPFLQGHHIVPTLSVYSPQDKELSKGRA